MNLILCESRHMNKDQTIYIEVKAFRTSIAYIDCKLNKTEPRTKSIMIPWATHKMNITNLNRTI